MGFHILQRLGITDRTFDKPDVTKDLVGAPGPHAKLGDQPLQPPAAPPSLATTTALAQSAATQAAAKQRKRAAAGDTLITGSATNSSKVKAKTTPTTLLGY